MTIHSREVLDEHLKKNTGFWKGIFLIAKLCCKFIISLGPQHWSLSRLAETEQKVQPTGGSTETEVRLEDKVLR